jgi:DNA-binding LytR/AlgR family response regulator
MRVIIVEDEKLAAERLVTMLAQYDPAIDVIACFESVEETAAYLRQHAHPDLLLLDIHLSDGHSFEIFKQVSYNKPVIFTTAFDQYALEAFRIFSIDYILKPVTQAALASAINKFKSLSVNFSAVDLTKLTSETGYQRYKKRFLGKVGQRLFFITSDNIAYLQADNKIVYLIDKEGSRYVVDYTLEQLQELVDPKLFFRLNRSFIVSINAIQQVKPWYNSRLKLSVLGNNNTDEMVVSRDRVADFKIWAEA